VGGGGGGGEGHEGKSAIILKWRTVRIFIELGTSIAPEKPGWDANVLRRRKCSATL